MTKKLFTLLCTLFILYGCASKKNIEQPIKVQSNDARIELLQTIKQWKINGKIAFIEKNKRESASIFWQYDQRQQSQKLNLTTFLGINVLSLISEKGLHIIEVDGETYRGNNLEQLIYSFTDLPLPTQALNFWLKGLPYSDNDQFSFNQLTGLPSELTSVYQGSTWHIQYRNYQQVNGMTLPHSFTIKQNELTIKISINQWTL
ncbi:lipoprotein insertase outer membrane protein LolB [Colwelliaceae bacterium 6441]